MMRKCFHRCLKYFHELGTLSKTNVMARAHGLHTGFGGGRQVGKKQASQVKVEISAGNRPSRLRVLSRHQQCITIPVYSHCPVPVELLHAPAGTAARGYQQELDVNALIEQLNRQLGALDERLQELEAQQQEGESPNQQGRVLRPCTSWQTSACTK
eukprot:1157118-Pelagomonas_calceolata.AAC.6